MIGKRKQIKGQQGRENQSISRARNFVYDAQIEVV